MVRWLKALRSVFATEKYSEPGNLSWGFDLETAKRYTASETVGRLAWGAETASVPLRNEACDRRISQYMGEMLDDHYTQHGPERAGIGAAKFAVSLHAVNPKLAQLVLRHMLNKQSDNFGTILRQAQRQYLPQARIAKQSHVLMGSMWGGGWSLAPALFLLCLRDQSPWYQPQGLLGCFAFPAIAGMAIGALYGAYKGHETRQAIALLQSFEGESPILATESV